jgi:hypothetical protein
MKCALCSSSIPTGVSECPQCGIPISYIISADEFPTDDQTISQPPLSTQATAQGPRLHEASWVPPLNTAPFQEIKPSRSALIRKRGFIVLGIIVILLIVASRSVFIKPAPPPAPNPYPPYKGTLVINDSLQNNSAGFNWMDDTVSQTPENKGCRFINGAYHIIDSIPQSSMVYCLALDTDFGNFVYQIQATLLKGSAIGIVFRQAPGYKYYYFYIGQDSSYGLLWNNGAHSQVLTTGVSFAIHPGLNQSNLLAVVANGTTLDLYVNKQHLASVIDDTFSRGRIGTAVESGVGSAIDAAFSHVMLWSLDQGVPS